MEEICLCVWIFCWDSSDRDIVKEVTIYHTDLQDMEHSHKEAIRKNWTYLLENLMVDDLLDYLISHSIITENMKEEVEIQRTRRDKATQLLFIVQKRGPKAFQILLDGLRECHMEFIADRLESSIWMLIMSLHCCEIVNECVAIPMVHLLKLLAYT